MLLHGFGSNMRDLASLCPAIDSEGYVYVCPNAPISVQIGPGTVGYAWFPPEGGEASGEARLSSEEALGSLLEEVLERYPVKPGHAVLGGFSQGGMISYSLGLTMPDAFEGLVALSAQIPDPEGLRARLPADRMQAIFIAHGTQDSMIPVDRARRALGFLEAEGYAPEYNEYDMAHQITQDVLDDLVSWIRRVLPPVRSGSEAGI